MNTTRSYKNFHLHTSVEDVSILFLDIIFNGDTYGSTTYYVIWENNTTYMHLSDAGMNEAYEISKNLLDDDFYNSIIENAKKLGNQIKATSFHLDDKNVFEQWKIYLDIMHGFCRLYMFRERPFQQALEEIVLRYHSEQEIIEIIEGNKKAHPEAENALNNPSLTVC